ncbi:CcdB-like toxin protein [Caenispirillum salinarum AK4]|uniref:Toxin CcdB n=1 Tax=Caenispirillum salinarum AK4 TaxID=1238182 RepID=K9H2M5_9PROT|nr:CcdB family protein [Caenispirillum salinarum]EKV32505.1 CcdB-like toxin protein [Caenispirillum salinarum AK4]
MPQFDVHRNRSPRSRKTHPYLLNIQVDHLAENATRVVIPLVPLGALVPARRLNPVFRIESGDYILSTLEIVNIRAADLGDVVASLESQRGEIIAALDFLISGI